MIVIERKFVARIEPIVLQADEVIDLKYLENQLEIQILLLLFLRDDERVSSVVAGVLELFDKRFRGFRA